MKVHSLEYLFPLGRILATPGAIDLLDRTGTNADDLLRRHLRGDWGVVRSTDARSNNLAVVNGTRILSAYEIGARFERLCVLTDADRRATVIMCPCEY
ncbi:hypothetical protein C7399_114157 [Paraburkholderia tropica]|uniref:Type I restriction endonuclease subunit M n=1 Tax=Paraburkholderia tropica TaxID=92647 RepID=A0ABX5MJZ5_9BURK|nr:hypothetical protein [Paraburkholderia tropica]PXX13588.1 hypothetical protein C7400_115157 [Paraburkholderia tropica]PZW78519.1 hypothetical protein C7399_114157 [Paraburkholderia tropica]